MIVRNSAGDFSCRGTPRAENSLTTHWQADQYHARLISCESTSTLVGPGWLLLLCQKLAKVNWCVNCNTPFEGCATVLEMSGRTEAQARNVADSDSEV